MYRINYGNGTVSNTFYTRQQCLREFRSTVTDGYGYVERYCGEGEWVKLKNPNKY